MASYGFIASSWLLPSLAVSCFWWLRLAWPKEAGEIACYTVYLSAEFVELPHCLFCKQIHDNFMTFHDFSCQVFARAKVAFWLAGGCNLHFMLSWQLVRLDKQGRRIFQKSLDALCEYGYDAKCNINASTAEFWSFPGTVRVSLVSAGCQESDINCSKPTDLAFWKSFHFRVQPKFRNTSGWICRGNGFSESSNLEWSQRRQHFFELVQQRLWSNDEQCVRQDAS